MEIQVMNALGDFLVFATALYAAYAVRKHQKESVSLALIAAAFFIGAIVFARDLRGIDFYEIKTFSFIIFAVFMVEATSHMVRGSGKLRLAHLLYIFLFLTAFSSRGYPEGLFIVHGSAILISYFIAAACFAVLIDDKRGEAQSLSFIGFLGAAFPLTMVLYNPLLLFAPWNFLFLIGKMLLAVFFLGFALHSRRDINYFCYRPAKKGVRK